MKSRTWNGIFRLGTLLTSVLIGSLLAKDLYLEAGFLLIITVYNVFYLNIGVRIQRH